MLVTRSRHQAAELVELLEAAGAEAIEAPVLRVAELDDFDALDLALDTASQCDWIVFTTVNGVDGFMHRLIDRGPRRARADRAANLRRRGRHERAPGPLRHPRRSGRPRGRAWTASSRRWAAARASPAGACCMPSAAGGRDTLGEALTAAGADVRQAPAFRTLAAEDNPDIDVYGQLLQHRIDVVTFTSAAAVRGFAGALRRGAGRRPAHPHDRGHGRAGRHRGHAPARRDPGDRAAGAVDLRRSSTPSARISSSIAERVRALIPEVLVP